MLPYPLHPAVVHFPVVLAFLLPLFVLGAFWMIRRGANARRAWILPVGCTVALSVSSWAAVRTGDGQSERVERVVSEQAIESHEELAEAFLAASAVVAIMGFVGLAPGLPGRVGRLVTGIGSLVLVGFVVPVGHSGGQLVYRYGAASAYTTHTGISSGEVAQPEADRNKRAR